MNMKKVVTGSLAGIMAVSAMAVNTFADLTTGTTVNQEAKEKTWNLTESGWKIQYPTSFTGKITYTMADADANGSVAENVAKYKAKMVYYIKAFDADSNGKADFAKPAVIDGDVKLAITGKHTNYYGNVTSQTVTATATPVKLANGLYKVTFWLTKHDDNLTGGNTISMNRFTYPRTKPDTVNTINESTEFTYNLSYNIVGSKVYTSKNDANKALNGLNVWSKVSNNSSLSTDHDSKELNKGLTWWDTNNTAAPSTYNGVYVPAGFTPGPGPDTGYPNVDAAKKTLETTKTAYNTAIAAYNTAKGKYTDAKNAVDALRRSGTAAFTPVELDALKGIVLGATGDLGDGTAGTATVNFVSGSTLGGALNKILPLDKQIGASGATADNITDGSTGGTLAAALGQAGVAALTAFATVETTSGYAIVEATGVESGTAVTPKATAEAAMDVAYVAVLTGAINDGISSSSLPQTYDWNDDISGTVTAKYADTFANFFNATAGFGKTTPASDVDTLMQSTRNVIEKFIADIASGAITKSVRATLADGSTEYRALAKQIDLALAVDGEDTIAGTTVNSGSSLGRQLSNIHGDLDKHDDGDLSDHNDVDSVKWVTLQKLTDDEEAKIAILHYLYNTKGATLTFNFAYDDNGDEEGRGKDGFSDDSDKLTGSKNALKEMSLRANEVGVMTEAKEMKDWSVSFDWDEIMQNTFGYDVNNTGNIWSLQAKLNMKNEALHDAIYDGNLYLKSVTVKVPEKTFTILAAGEGTSDSTEDVVAPESSDASSESSSEAESSEASSVESSEPAPETPVTNPSTGNAPIALAVIPVAVAAAAVIIKKRG